MYHSIKSKISSSIDTITERIILSINFNTIFNVKQPALIVITTNTAISIAIATTGNSKTAIKAIGPMIVSIAALINAKITPIKNVIIKNVFKIFPIFKHHPSLINSMTFPIHVHIKEIVY